MNSNNEKRKSPNTKHGLTPWVRKVLNFGCASTLDSGPTSFISVKVFIAPTFRAKSVSSIRFRMISLADPEKFMLIDLFDADTNKPVGE